MALCGGFIKHAAMSDTADSARYDFATAEPHWQAAWEQAACFKAEDVPTSGRPKYYVLEMFPYPSGKIHMGHVRNYTLGDVVARYKRATGFDVLHPMGWDAFGLPAENAARQRKTDPAAWTYANIEAMRAELKRMGLSLDWSREFATCDPEYYGQQQKLFLDFWKAGLVERRSSAVNWDPVDNTVLANEQVIDGRGWLSGALVEKKFLAQWFLKITDFAPELLDGPARPAALARARQTDAGKLDRPVRRRGSHLQADPASWTGWTASPSTPRGRTRCSACPSSPSPRNIPSPRRSRRRTLRPPPSSAPAPHAAPPRRPSNPPRRKASSPGSPWSTRSTARPSRSGSPISC